MNQKLSDWANISQVVSGIAVVITLVFLIVGIRENTDVTRAAMYQESSNSLNEWRRDVLSDPEIAELFYAFINNQAEGIEGVDRIRLTQLILNNFQISENAFFAQRYGLLGRAEWSRFERSICDNYARAASARLTDTLQLVLTKDFTDYISATC